MKAMIFAAGRGARMRPLTDATPKPLLQAGGKPLIAWTLEALARAGFTDIVINHAWLGEQIPAALGDGSRWGVRIAYSAEDEALETAGGIAQALPLLREREATQGGQVAQSPAPDGAQHSVFLAVSGDIWTTYDFASLRARAARMALLAEPAMHLVMVPNPEFYPRGDFALEGEALALDGPARLTFGNIGLYDTRSFAAITPGTRLALGVLFREAILEGRATGECYAGPWANVGTPAHLAALDLDLSGQRG